ncbi:MAG: hypothetical protein LQ338_007495 [Usnochroma carphineum]|nr:MAG: hypothetical protein LQ338_007495 [Usnochroma carphineum]
MGLSRFTSLPPEVIVRIFQHVSDFATAHALVRTSSVFHCVWLMNANTIAITILPKAIECYHEARALVGAQERAETFASNVGGRRKSHREVVIVLVRRYLEDARLLIGFYESHIVPVLERTGSNTTNLYARPLLERKRFLKTLYHLRTLAFMHKANDGSSSFLSDIEEWDLIDVSEVTSWIRRRLSPEWRRELGVDTLLTESKWLQTWLDGRLAVIQQASECLTRSERYIDL